MGRVDGNVIAALYVQDAGPLTCVPSLYQVVFIVFGVQVTSISTGPVSVFKLSSLHNAPLGKSVEYAGIVNIERIAVKQIVPICFFIL